MALFLPEPAPLPVTLADVKAYLRLGVDDEDALIEGLARAAGDLCEAFTGRSLVARAIEEILPAATAWARLTAAPVRGIAGVAALDADGEAEALAAETYAAEVDAAGDGWVRLTNAGDAKRIRVSYEAGMASNPDALPDALRHGIVRLAAHFYMHRDSLDESDPPAVVTALWRPWRRLPFGFAQNKRVR